MTPAISAARCRLGRAGVGVANVDLSRARPHNGVNAPTGNPDPAAEHTVGGLWRPRRDRAADASYSPWRMEALGITVSSCAAELGSSAWQDRAASRSGHGAPGCRPQARSLRDPEQRETRCRVMEMAAPWAVRVIRPLPLPGRRHMIASQRSRHATGRSSQRGPRRDRREGGRPEATAPASLRARSILRDQRRPSRRSHRPEKPVRRTSASTAEPRSSSPRSRTAQARSPGRRSARTR